MRNNDEYYTHKNIIRKKYMRITVRVFTTVLLVIGFTGLLIPLRPKESQVEKRELTHFPKPTWETFTNGKFFDGISTWYADTFPFREGLTSANAKFKKLYGITTEEIHGDVVQGDEIPDPDAEITSTPIPTATPTPEPDATIHDEPEKAGTIYVVDNRGFEIYGFSRDGADGYINMINTAATQLKDVATVYDILVPTSIAVNLDEENQKKINSSSQEDTFAYVYGHLDPSIVQVPVLDILKKHNSEYLYFKTDHHWTSLGAKYAFEALCQPLGIQNPAQEYLIYPVTHTFLGTLASKSGYNRSEDTIDIYIPKTGNMNYMVDYVEEQKKTSSIYVSEALEQKDKYEVFFGGNHTRIDISTPLTENKNLLLIKDSYANCFVQFLIPYYRTITIVDPRYYYENIDRLIQDNSITDILFLYNVNTFMTDNSIADVLEAEE